MELGNRQEQRDVIWKQTGAQCSLEVNKTVERYLGSDRRKVFS